MPGGRRRLESWWRTASPGISRSWEAASHPDDIHAWAGGIRPSAKGRAWGESPRWNVLGWASRASHPPLVSRSPLRDCRDGSRQERAPDHVTAITPARYTGTSRGEWRARNFRRVAACCGRPWTTPIHGRMPGYTIFHIPKVNNNCTQGASGSMAQPGRAPDS